MTINATKKHTMEKWPPKALKDHIEQCLKPDHQADDATKSALNRICDPNNFELKLVYEKLIKKHDLAIVAQYFIQVCSIYLGNSLHQPISAKTYKDWLLKISKEAEKLAGTINNTPTSDLMRPDWLCNADGLLSPMIESYGGDEGDFSESSSSQFIRQGLRMIDLPMLLLELAKLARDESQNKPKPSWECELGINASKKMGEDNVLAYEQILIKTIKRLTVKTFGDPYHNVVADLINTLLDTEKFSEDSITKTP
jgi:hypothetical protein